jgi:hypothetical protein
VSPSFRSDISPTVQALPGAGELSEIIQHQEAFWCITGYVNEENATPDNENRKSAQDKIRADRVAGEPDLRCFFAAIQDSLSAVFPQQEQ